MSPRRRNAAQPLHSNSGAIVVRAVLVAATAALVALLGGACVADVGAAGARGGRCVLSGGSAGGSRRWRWR
eukprot:12559725-Alexandrium_andersonii.AAC.1